MEAFDISKIKLEERYESEEYDTTTLYFIAPKKLLDGKYPEATHAEISVEYPTNNPEAHAATVMLSPSQKYDDSYSAYDWTDIDLPYEHIEALIRLGNR